MIKMKKLLCLALIGMLFLSGGQKCLASEIDGEYGNNSIVDKEEFVIVDRVSMTDGKARVNWGEGILYGKDPIFSAPSCYAETRTFSGTAYSIKAELQLIDDDDISYFTDEVVGSNVSSVYTATLLSPTERCGFYGIHQIKDISSSSWQKYYTSKTYD